MSEFLYEVGDEYEGSPILASKFISQVLAAGGLVEVDGDIVRIVYLPASVHGKEQVLDRYKDEAPSAEVKSEKAAEVEAPKEPAPEEEVEPVVEEVKVEEEPEKPAPKKRGRPRKTKTVEEG